MKQLAAALALITLAVSVPASVDEAGSRLFTCDVEDVREFIDAGTLGPPTALSKEIMKNPLNFDEASGLLRSPAGPLPVQYKIWNPGVPGSGNDLVAYRGERTATGSDPFTVLRIRVWAEGVPFLYLTALWVITGTCQIEKPAHFPQMTSFRHVPQLISCR